MLRCPAFAMTASSLEHLTVDVAPDEEELTLTFRHAKVPGGEMVFEAGEDRELVDAVRTVFRLWSR
jgi:hypothetical protein